MFLITATWWSHMPTFQLGSLVIQCSTPQQTATLQHILSNFIFFSLSLFRLLSSHPASHSLSPTTSPIPIICLAWQMRFPQFLQKRKICQTEKTPVHTLFCLSHLSVCVSRCCFACITWEKCHDCRWLTKINYSQYIIHTAAWYVSAIIS